MHELVLRNGRVIDPGCGRDEVTDVGFAGGKVAAVGAGLRGAAERDVSGCIVMPGNIDFHTHVYWGGTSIGIDADQLARRAGTTTWLDVGTAGPGNFLGFRKHVIERSQTRILAYLHVSHAGIFAFSPTVMVGESLDMRLMDTAHCAEGGAGQCGPDPRHQGARGRHYQRRERDRAAASRAGGRRSGRAAGDVPHRPAAAALCRRAGGVAARRYADALLQAVPERALHRRRPGQGGVLGGARTRRVVRHRPRRRIVRFRRRGDDAQCRVPPGYHQLGRPTSSASTGRRSTIWKP